MKGIQNRFIKKFLAVTLATVFLLTACAGSSMSADVKAEAAAPQAMTNGSYYDYDSGVMEEVEMGQ